MTPCGGESAPGGEDEARDAGPDRRAARHQDEIPDQDEIRARARRRRRLDEVFGDVMPAVTQDERGPGFGSGSGFSVAHYRENRPPHHGGQ